MRVILLENEPIKAPIVSVLNPPDQVGQTIGMVRRKYVTFVLRHVLTFSRNDLATDIGQESRAGTISCESIYS